jgi:Tfp pilus assembly protein PilW
VTTAARPPWRPALAQRLRRRLQGDDGTSLIELTVGMLLMSIFLAMFTGAIVMMNSAMNKSQAVNLSASQLNVAFASLDNMVRYAAFISTPKVGSPSGDWYVEFRVTTTGAEVCNQLRVDIASKQLQRRTWTVAGGVASTPSAWVPIASGISNGGAAAGAKTQPFYLVTPVGNAVSQQLTFNLVSPAGAGSALTNSVSSFTFTALNSPVGVVGTQICQQQGQP